VQGAPGLYALAGRLVEETYEALTARSRGPRRKTASAARASSIWASSRRRFRR